MEGKPKKPTLDDFRRRYDRETVGVVFEVRRERESRPSLRDRIESLKTPVELPPEEDVPRDSLKVPGRADLTVLGHAGTKLRTHPIAKKAKRISQLPVKHQVRHVVSRTHHRVKRMIKHPFFVRHRAVLLAMLMVAAIGVILYQGTLAKQAYEKRVISAQDHLGHAFELIDRGDMVGALRETDAAREDINRIKVLAQAWGQDINYLSLLPAKSSKLVAYERFLNGAYGVLSTLSAVNSELGVAIKRGAIMGANKDVNQLPSIDLVGLRETIVPSLQKTQRDLDASARDLSLAKDALPKDLSKQCEAALAVIGRIDNSLGYTKALLNNGLPWLSGNDGRPKKIMLVFQNNSEIRGSGGFIGSFAIAEFREGKLLGLDFETNIYKLDNPFTAANKVTPPTELQHLSNGAWSLRDSNYAVDFPESADKIKEFYNLETGRSVDGIIALDTTLFIHLLKAVGPIDMPEYNLKVTDQNFLKDVQYEVEKGYYQDPKNRIENEPKKILATLMPRFINALVGALGDQDRFPKVLEAMSKGLAEKHLLFNFDDADMQEMLESLNYAGKIEHRLTDYLFVHSTNLGAAKSSLSIEETVQHSVMIDAKGIINERVKLARSHRGSYTWPDNNDISVMRILLPDGSKVSNFSPVSGNFWPNMLEAYKNEPSYSIGEEAGKAKVTFWQNTKPGETTRSTLEYRPNYTVNTDGDMFTYRLYVQKQPGTLGSEYELFINYPDGFEPVNVKNYDFINRQVVIKDYLKTDKEYSIQFRKIK